MKPSLSVSMATMKIPMFVCAHALRRLRPGHCQDVPVDSLYLLVEGSPETETQMNMDRSRI